MSDEQRRRQTEQDEGTPERGAHVPGFEVTGDRLPLRIAIVVLPIADALSIGRTLVGCFQHRLLLSQRAERFLEHQPGIARHVPLVLPIFGDDVTVAGNREAASNPETEVIVFRGSKRLVVLVDRHHGAAPKQNRSVHGHAVFGQQVEVDVFMELRDAAHRLGELAVS